MSREMVWRKHCSWMKKKSIQMVTLGCRSRMGAGRGTAVKEGARAAAVARVMLPLRVATSGP